MEANNNIIMVNEGTDEWPSIDRICPGNTEATILAVRPLDESLEDVHTVGELQNLKEELENHAMDSVEFSKLAFRAFLKNQVLFDQVIAFLKTPHLNLPDARNMSTLINHLSLHGIKRKDESAFVTTLQESIALGTVLPNELLDIIEKAELVANQVAMQQSKQKAHMKRTRAQSHKFLFEVYHAIWKGMLDCRATPLNMGAIHSLIPKVATLRGGHGSTSLYLELAKHAWPIRGTDRSSSPRTMDQFLLSWIEYVHQNERQKVPTLAADLISLDRNTLTNIIDTINRIPATDSFCWITSTTRLLASKKTNIEGPELAAWSAKLDIFLSCLRESEKFKAQFDLVVVRDEKVRYQVREVWYNVYRILSKHVALADLIPHLSQFESVEICRIILHCWLPIQPTPFASRSWMPQSHGNWVRQPPRIWRPSHSELEKTTPLGYWKWDRQSNRGDLKKLYNEFWVNPARFGPLEKMKVRFESMMDAERGGEDLVDKICFPNLLATIIWSGLPHKNLMSEVCKILYQHQGPASLLQLFEFLRKKEVPMYSGPVLKVLTNIFESNPVLAYIFYKCHNIWISRCPELLITLVKEGVHTTEILRILNDREPENTVPLAERSDPKNTASDLRNTLVHMIADTISRHPHRGPRSAFREVTECYNYLKTRNAPINPIMGRALVRSGIAMFLQDNRWASTERFKWILAVVREAEGDEVANELDTVVFRWRERVKAFKREQLRILREERNQLWHQSVPPFVEPDEWFGPKASKNNSQPSPTWDKGSLKRGQWRKTGQRVLPSRAFRIKSHGSATSDARLEPQLLSRAMEQYLKRRKELLQQKLRGLPHEEFVHRYLNDDQIYVTADKYNSVRRTGWVVTKKQAMTRNDATGGQKSYPGRIPALQKSERGAQESTTLLAVPFAIPPNVSADNFSEDTPATNIGEEAATVEERKVSPAHIWEARDKAAIAMTGAESAQNGQGAALWAEAEITELEFAQIQSANKPLPEISETEDAVFHFSTTNSLSGSFYASKKEKPESSAFTPAVSAKSQSSRGTSSPHGWDLRRRERHMSRLEKWRNKQKESKEKSS
jgi:hypothetical protein